MRFQYSALTADGQPVSGTLDMPDAASVLAHLQLQGLLPIEAVDRVIARQDALLGWTRPTKQLPGRDLILVTRQLSRLSAAGLPFDRALQIITGLLQVRKSRVVIEALHASVCDGGSLSEAMANQDGAFPPVVLAMVRAGEQGGVIAPVLGRAADFLERSEAVRQSVLSALIYPAILATVAGLAIALVLTVVLPEFEPMFKEAGSRLPFITQIVMAAGRDVRGYWWILPPIALGLVWGWQRAMRRPRLRWLIARASLMMPLIGSLVTRHDAARFARTLSALLANGVASERALGLAAGVVQNAVISSGLREATEQLKRGEGLSGPLQAAGNLPPILIQLARVGEETGRLSELLSEAAGLLEADAQRNVDRLLALLVPTLTIGMGMIIATIVASVLLAMLSINDLAG